MEIIMINVHTGNEHLDTAVDALIKRCRIPEDFSLTVCCDTDELSSESQYIIVIYTDKTYEACPIHKEYARLYGDRYSAVQRPFAFSAFEEILTSFSSAKPHKSAKPSEKVKYDSAARKITRGGCSAILSAKEAELFEYLSRHKGRPVSREELRQSIWPDTEASNAPDVYVTYLRQKLKGVLGDGVIVNVRGKGYILKY